MSELDLWRLKSRQAVTRLAVEFFLGSEWDRAPQPELRIIYLVVLEATLAGRAIAASKIALITRIQRTTVRRRLVALRKQGVLSYIEGSGWRVTEEHLNRPGARDWLLRLEAMVRRTHETMLADSAN